MFVCIEGIDGAGKSTQSRLLVNALNDAGQPAELVWDPGTTELGKAIRELILTRNDPITPYAQMLLFSSARAELSAQIQTLMAAGKTVVCDRWILSTLVYQVAGNKLDERLVMDIFRATCIVPNLCFILDLAPEAAELRRAPSKDRYESRPLEEKRAMRQAYLEYGKSRPDRKCAQKTTILDADAPQEEIQRKIFEAVEFEISHARKQYDQRALC